MIYTPTERERDIIRSLRLEIQWASRKLNEAIDALAKYESSIRTKPGEDALGESKQTPDRVL
jgi:hypothetical protein